MDAHCGARKHTRAAHLTHQWCALDLDSDFSFVFSHGFRPRWTGLYYLQYHISLQHYGSALIGSPNGLFGLYIHISLCAKEGDTHAHAHAHANTVGSWRAVWRSNFANKKANWRSFKWKA